MNNKITSSFSIILLIVFFSLQSCKSHSDIISIYSPDKHVKVDFGLDEDGKPNYTVFYGDVQIIEPSNLGLETSQGQFSQGLKLIGAQKNMMEDKYNLISGKRKICTYKANQNIFTLKNVDGVMFAISFQVSDNGVAFRYSFPEKDTVGFTIENENTTYSFFSNTKAWLQPLDEVSTGFCGTNPSYERHYLQEVPVGTACPTKAGWAYPALFKYNNIWALISETGIEATHCVSRLKNNSSGEYKVAFPMEGETFTNGELLSNSSSPWNLPWRIIALGDDLADIAESTLGTDLAAPSNLNNTDWVVPGKSSWSWVLLKDDFTTYPVQKEFIDYASEMGWDYCLIDAYWDQKIGYKNIEKLASYAKTKSVGLLVWYNSAGDWNTTKMTPRDMLTNKEKRRHEFKRLQDIGIKGIKVDFFGGDGQSMIAYYHEILKDAADYKLLVNFHGATLPRGLQRTYPHYLTNESIKGYEYVTFFQNDMDQLCNHASMLPFTRNCFDPMDFTPMCFSEVPNINRVSTNGFELATSIVFVSGIQHYAETAQGMQNVPDFVKSFIMDIPCVWEDVKFIDGYPGKYVVIARKGGDNWYIAGINGENKDKELALDLSLLGEFAKAEMITDGDNNRSFKQLKINTNELGNQKINLKSNGGFVIRLSTNP